MYNSIIIQKERVEDLANEKDNDTINDLLKSIAQPPQANLRFNENDPIEVNNLLTLADSDITEDLLAQLEQRAKEEQAKMENIELQPEPLQVQEDIQIAEGLPGEGGSVNITGEIMERPKPPEEEIETRQPEQLDPLEEAKLNAVYKKYVIYINKENENFIDSLSLNERKQLINDVLREQNAISEAQKAEKARIERIIKTAIALVTFIISVPIVYLIFNVSMEATIQNYRHSKSNFEVLYKETGKIKINSNY